MSAIGTEQTIAAAAGRQLAGVKPTRSRNSRTVTVDPQQTKASRASANKNVAILNARLRVGPTCTAPPWTGEVKCRQLPDAERAHFLSAALAGTRATVAPYPKVAVMKWLLEFLNDEAW